jgi:hypothetical protein
MVFCVSEGAQQRAEQSRYHCIRAAAASERCVLPLDEVADVSVSHHGPASCQHPLAVVGQDSLWMDGSTTKAPLCRVWPADGGGRLWQLLEESGQRRVMADDRRHGMTSVMMCPGGWCCIWVPWLACFADALSPKVARAGQFSLATAAMLMYV